MQRLQTTPPMLQVDGPYDSYGQPGSATTSVSSGTPDCSPSSYLTADSTPPTTSPAYFRECGQLLLPRMRNQDQIAEPVQASRYAHGRTQSLPNNNGYPMHFGAQLQIPASLPPQVEQSWSAPGFNFNASPQSATAAMHSPQTTYAPVMANQLHQPQVRGHVRNLSASSIDINSVPTRFRYPTYRVGSPAQASGVTVAHNAMSHLLPMAGMSAGPTQSYPYRRRNASPPSKPSRLSAEPQIAENLPSTPAEETTLAQYLSKPNPKSALVPKEHLPQFLPGQNDAYWWDVRNVNPWLDFSVDTISSFEGLPKLLNFPTSLAEPKRNVPHPETRSQLAENFSRFHLQKLNTALSFVQGSDHHISAQATPHSSPTKQAQRPDFVANYSSDSERTLSGDVRGRVVGIARCFNEWNTGMRSSDNLKKVEFLKGLSALHKHMRDHRCRYGYIVTEIELVCVRIGGGGNREGTPFFGFVEMATIPMSTEGFDANGRMQMTADLALWYLHMLAKDQTLPGQMDWQLHLGGPAACSRQVHLRKDSWMPNPLQKEQRMAKLKRKWVMPEEEITGQEAGRSRRRAAVAA